MKGIHLLSLGTLLASLCQNSVSTKQNKCPNIRVGKNEIIQAQESLKAGAKFLSSKKTPNARDCYQRCCDEKICDLAQIQYKNSSRGVVERTCYLFQCGYPTKCSFRYHDHHATIHFAKREETHKVKSEVISKRPQHHAVCPPGVPEAMCLLDPCVKASCPTNPYATCRTSFCGFCHAEFLDDDGEKVDCDVVKETSEEKDLETSYEQGQREKWGKADHKSKMVALKKKPVPTKSVYHRIKTTLKAIPKHLDVHSSVDDKFSYEEFEHTLYKLNPVKEKTAPPTVKPTEAEAPTTFHHWREFVDNNPNFPQPTWKKEVFKVDWESGPTLPPTERETPTEKETPTEVYPPTEKVVPVKKYPPIKKKPPVDEKDSREKEVPTKKVPPAMEIVITASSPVDERDEIPQAHPAVIPRKLPKNVTDVVLIENNHLKIVENKAVLPLAIFLVVAILLLFVVALRLRVVKSKLRRRPFATDDADYLINGMYL